MLSITPEPRPFCAAAPDSFERMSCVDAGWFRRALYEAVRVGVPGSRAPPPFHRPLPSPTDRFGVLVPDEMTCRGGVFPGTHAGEKRLGLGDSQTDIVVSSKKGSRINRILSHRFGLILENKSYP